MSGSWKARQTMIGSSPRSLSRRTNSARHRVRPSSPIRFWMIRQRTISPQCSRESKRSPLRRTLGTERRSTDSAHKAFDVDLQRGRGVADEAAEEEWRIRPTYRKQETELCLAQCGLPLTVPLRDGQEAWD